ncbi:MAG: cysteine--tRNA ligase [Desulfobacterales bacterium]|nr:cysteine--tRNA ligase [Desulfobacterales bacterium]
MSLKIYNTLTGKKEDFIPVHPNEARMYVCGPTVYDSCHIGHARSAIVFDVIARYLKFKGLKLTYVRNFTDIDDKIINRAKELNIDPKQVAEKYIEEFYQDMDSLNVERATIEPKATENIDEIINIIQKLIDKSFAYAVDGDVYFSVELFKNYGKLSKRSLDEMEAGARIEINPNKKNPFDFALWKKAKEDEPFWESPWGKGRPGWHIECSAMSERFLGETFDIHGGGKDLIFPHHENEIAQSEAASGKEFARYWVHNGFVNINNEKMSKSLGNFMMIKDIRAEYHSDIIRLFLLSNHYRSPIDFNDKVMEDARISLDKIYSLIERIDMLLKTHKKEKLTEQHPGKYLKSFCEAMDDDFNTAKAIGIIFDAVRTINKFLDLKKKNLSKEEIHELKVDKEDIIRMGKIFGILEENPSNYFEKTKLMFIKKKNIDIHTIDNMIKKRSDARKNKNFAEADSTRKELEDMGIILEDRPEGTIWKIK